ncbi:hypothetical protein Tco_1149968 [Tanacetum coccineum]
MGGTPAQTRSERVLEQPNEPPLSEGHTSGSGERRMEQTFELTDNIPPTPYDSPLIKGYTPGSDEGRLKLDELITLCTKLSKQVLDLEKEKDAQAMEILNLKKRVKKLERKRKSSISHLRRRKYKQVETSFDDGLDEEDVSKQGRRSDKIKPMFKDKDFEELDDHSESVEEEIVDAATTGVSIVSAPVSTAGMRSVKAKDKGKVIMKEDESVQKKLKKQLEKERLRDVEIAQQLQEEFVRARQEQEVVAKANQAHYIDWSDPAMLREDTSRDISRKVHFEDTMKYWKIIRVGDHTEVYQIFEDILKNFDREDLVKLWSLVHEKFNSTEPINDKERALWVELKRLFEPDEDDVLWKLQRYMHDPLTWKL